jgi:hypothetical protein
VPVVRVEVERLAVLPESVTVPSVTPPDLNVTVPVGLPLVVTVAVNSTASPTIEGFRLETTVVVLEYLLTTSFSAGDVLAVLFTSPTYLAVMERFPDVLKETLMLACPFTRVAEPSAVPLDSKFTVPLAAPRYWLVTVTV